MESDPPPADYKERAEKMIALACGNTGLVNVISVGLMIFCTLSFWNAKKLIDIMMQFSW